MVETEMRQLNAFMSKYATQAREEAVSFIWS